MGRVSSPDLQSWLPPVENDRRAQVTTCTPLAYVCHARGIGGEGKEQAWRDTAGPFANRRQNGNSMRDPAAACPGVSCCRENAGSVTPRFAQPPHPRPFSPGVPVEMGEKFLRAGLQAAGSAHCASRYGTSGRGYRHLPTGLRSRLRSLRGRVAPHPLGSPELGPGGSPGCRCAATARS